MRKFVTPLLAALAVATALTIAGPSAGPVQPVFANEPELAEPADEYVIVRRQRGTRIFARGAEPPALDELGYEVLPVPEGMSRDEYIAELEDEPGIESAEPDVRVYAAATPNDPFYQGSQRAYLESIGVPAAWDLAVGREQIVVAVIDSGADLSHPDLAPRLWRNPGEIAGNNHDDNASGCIDDVHGCRFVTVTPLNQAACSYTPQDTVATGKVQDDHGRPGSAEHSHGTMVSGIIGAAGNNGIGITGVAWNVRLMIVKVLDCGPTGNPGGQMSDVARGIDYARRMGADIINISLASPPGDENGNNAMLRDAIAAAEMQGVIIVAAAGNYGSMSDPRPGYPAAYTQYSNLIAVGASNWQQGQTWISTSSWGSALDFAAPGNNISGTLRTDRANPPYGSANGTSFSAPLVSGMFALMKSANSRLGHHAYIDLARQAATPAPPAHHGGNWAGSGIINVRGAVERIPMLITGFAMHDWVDVPPDTRVEARIGNARCGETRTVDFGVASRFELHIAPSAATTGCGSPGRTVSIYIDGILARKTFTWGGPTQELVYASQDVSSVSPPPGPIIVQELSPGWNNIAHFEDNGTPPNALSYLPSTWDSAFFWDALTAAFLRALRTAPEFAQGWATVQRWDAYWVHVPAGGNAASINPSPQPGRTIELEQGWNNFTFTGTSEEISLALSALEGKYDSVYRYDNTMGEWLSYLPDTARFANSLGGLLTARVYWIHMLEPATLTMN